MSPEQPELAFMPPANDVNEGALGAWRVWTRRFPRLALHEYNALMSNCANGTEDYMEAHFTAEQYKWTQKEALRINALRVEETRKANLVIADEQEAEKNRKVQEKRSEKRAQKQQYAAAIQIELDPAGIAIIKGPQLNDQIKAYRQLLVNQPGFPSTSKLKVGEKRALIADLALKYVQAKYMLQATSS